ncbi:RNA polymerase sigma-70 factor [Rathayibacter sp. VKM Ac-2762]|uniref:RNA polymerase sigma-70 factor n=1 Tax=Rathayibacter sp. VKM Ac-2762 TaxID=2609254 RepID=UPI001FC96875|nr:RNA polymerase sigma-70 factor [Rathayibacter sp. VKM Ac-2762]
MDDQSDVDRVVASFMGARPRMFGIAYRMLGSVSQAEDVLQEVWIRWQGTDTDAIREPVAFLTTATTRIAINVLQSARHRRETYIGPWLPEPVDTSSDPALGAERGEALEMAVLLLLEKLTPTERAAYVLREAFDYPYDRIADIVRISPAGARQLVSRARKHLGEERSRSVPDQQRRRLLDAFVSAARRGDMDALEQLFDEDIVSVSDGGGVVRASRIPVAGRGRVAAFVRAFAPRFWTDVAVHPVDVNGESAVALTRAGEGRPFAVVTIVTSDTGISRLLWLMNPHKLTGMPDQVAG